MNAFPHVGFVQPLFEPVGNRRSQDVMRRQAGFTLIEILVSIGIFVVAALVMLGTLLTASEIFRRGESARQAGDEATAVLAALRDDLARAVPMRLRDGVPAPEWGRLFADRQAPAGNCLLAFVIENPDRTAVKQDGSGSRLWVRWEVLPDASDPTPTMDQLHRTTWTWSAGSNHIPLVGAIDEVVTRGCLHFGAWLELEGVDLSGQSLHRKVTVDGGSPMINWEAQPPDVGGSYDSSVMAAADALRISLVLTGGGRYAARGTLARKLDQGHVADAQIAGIKALSTISGSALRIENEWIGYDNLRGGKLVGLKRGVWRSVDDDHPARSLVLAGQPFSLVVALPR